MEPYDAPEPTDPPLEPPNAVSAMNVANIAAVAVWVAGAVQLLMFGCCGLGMFAAGSVPPEEFQKLLSESLPPDQMEALAPHLPALQTATFIVSIFIGLLLVLPALVMLYLGFGVRRGHRGKMLAAQIIATVTAAVAALLLLVMLLQAVSLGALGSAIFNLALMGGLLAVLIWAIIATRRARRASDGLSIDEDEPWNTNANGGW